MKPYTHIGQCNEDLVELIKSRGLVANSDELLGILNAVGYYRLKGYLVPFYLQGAEVFRPGVTLSEVWDVYSFDRKLRENVLAGIARIEIAFRAKIVKVACKINPDPLAYSRPGFFAKFSPQDHEDILKRIAKAVHQSRNEPFLEYAYKTYGFKDTPPIWTMMEVLSMGTLIEFYRGLPTDAQVEIANGFHVRPTVFMSWMTLVRKVRNVCAHHGRLWNRHLQNPPTRKIGAAKELVHLEECLNIQTQISYASVFTALSIVAYCISIVRPQSKWVLRCSDLLATATPFILRGMGVPTGWRTLAIWENK